MEITNKKIEWLQSLVSMHERNQQLAQRRRDRLMKLIEKNSYKTLSAEKQQRMIKRLQASLNAIDASQKQLDSIKNTLQNLS